MGWDAPSCRLAKSIGTNRTAQGNVVCSDFDRKCGTQGWNILMVCRTFKIVYLLNFLLFTYRMNTMVKL